MSCWLRCILSRCASALLPLCGLWLALFPTVLCSAPFDEQVTFTQPDGQVIVLRGRGDEFQAVFETLDGYTVVFDPRRNAYGYALLAADGTLVPSTQLVGQVDPLTLGLTKGLRMGAEARKRQVVERWQRWEDVMQIESAWAARKAALRQLEEGGQPGDPQLAPPSFTTTGTKVGLTLLVDFSDSPATVPQAEVVAFCNGNNYTSFGNNGSVKQYFYDNSNGLLTYSNVVTIYVRAPRPKSYYNVTTNDAGVQANILIKDALDTLKAMPNYATEILPAFADLTVDSSSRVVAFNVFYAGDNGGVWSYGLWPHSWALYNAGAQALGNGKSVYKYQLTNIGSSLSIGTFCHENGHMLCGYPDIYDYDYDSSGGAGGFCLMNSGGSGGNPTQICAYLKRASGWATTINLTTNSSVLGTLGTTGTNINRFYRLAKPGVSTEYFLLENRQRTGRDANIPGSGILIWHVDELGNHNNQSTNYNTTHANYEVALVQADNLYHLERNSNKGDANDPFYSGNPSAAYRNEFSDTTSPPARWWDGTFSGASFTSFSGANSTMTFRAGPLEPPLTVAFTLLADANGNGVVDYNETCQYWVVLRNDGTSIATNATASLTTTTPQVNVLAGEATYPDAAPGQLTTNRTPFVFTTGASFPCGQAINFTALATVPGRVTSNGWAQATGVTPPTLRQDNNVAQAIPDLATIYSTNVVSGFTGAVGKVTVSLYITHAYDGNLVIDLLAPDGTTNNLVNRAGGSSDHFGTNCTPDSSRTTFDDAAAIAIASGSAPFVGTFRPQVPFTVYRGKSGTAVNGAWRLRIRDAAANNTGTLQCWSLQITPAANCLDGSLQPPVVTLETPADRALVPAGEAIPIVATVTDPDSPLVSVEFTADGLPLAAFTEPPFTFLWTNAAPGAHTLRVRALDTTGLFAEATALIGVTDASAMQWRGDLSGLWSEGFNWTAFRAPTNGEPLVFNAPARALSTNDALTTVGGLQFAGGLFTLSGNWLTLTGGITSAGYPTLEFPLRLGSAQTFLSTSGLLTLQGNLTNAGFGLTVDGDGDVLLNGLITGGGGLAKRGAGTTTLNQANNYTGGTVVHAGTLALARGGVIGSVRGSLTVNAGATARTEQTDALGTGSTRANPILVPGGTLIHAANANLLFWGMTVTLTGGTITTASGGAASLDFGTDSTIGSAACVVTSAASTNSSVISGNLIRLRQASTILNVAEGEAHPDLLITAPIASLTNNSGINKVGAGTLLLSSTNTYNGPTTVNGGTLLLTGRIGTNLTTVGYGATLGGTGVVLGRVVVNNGGTLAPGDGFGSLTISNTLQLNGTAQFEIARQGGSLVGDAIAGLSTVTYGGVLSVTNLGDDLIEGDAFRLFAAANYQGSFLNLSLPPLADGLVWDLSALATSGTIRVGALPVVLTQPEGLAVRVGERAAFAVLASGTPPLLYQWRKAGLAVAGATDAELVFPAATLDDAGSYDVLVSNPLGSVASASAQLSVVPPPPVLEAHVEGTTLTLSWPATPGLKLQCQITADGNAPAGEWFDVLGVSGNAYVVPVNQGVGAAFYRLVQP